MVEAVTQAADRGTSFGIADSRWRRNWRGSCDAERSRSGIGANGQFRNGSDDERAAIGPGLYEAEQDSQVRRAATMVTQIQPADQSRLGGGHVGVAGQPGGSGIVAANTL